MKQSDVNQLVDAFKQVFATKEDIQQLDTKVSGLDAKVSDLDTKFDEIDEKITKLDTKQDNMDIKLDGFLGEILASREEQTLQGEKIDNHTDELEKHEQRIKVLEHRKQSSPVPLSSLT